MTTVAEAEVTLEIAARPGVVFSYLTDAERYVRWMGATATLEAAYLGARLWIAKLDLPAPVLDYLNAHGAPIRYAHEPTPGRGQRPG